MGPCLLVRLSFVVRQASGADAPSSSSAFPTRVATPTRQRERSCVGGLMESGHRGRNRDGIGALGASVMASLAEPKATFGADAPSSSSAFPTRVATPTRQRERSCVGGLMESGHRGRNRDGIGALGASVMASLAEPKATFGADAPSSSSAFPTRVATPTRQRERSCGGGLMESGHRGRNRDGIGALGASVMASLAEPKATFGADAPSSSSAFPTRVATPTRQRERSCGGGLMESGHRGRNRDGIGALGASVMASLAEPKATFGADAPSSSSAFPTRVATPTRQRERSCGGGLMESGHRGRNRDGIGALGASVMASLAEPKATFGADAPSSSSAFPTRVATPTRQRERSCGVGSMESGHRGRNGDRGGALGASVIASLAEPKATFPRPPRDAGA
jgi:hypothetical protein